jgi:hypothetical protein
VLENFSFTEGRARAALPPLTAEQLDQQERALIAAFGILKGTGVFPEDALDYQYEVRAEWR